MRVSRQLACRRYPHERKRAVILVGVVAGMSRRFQRLRRSKALNVGDVKHLSARIMNNGTREPADGNQAKQLRFAAREVKYRDGILGPVADEQPLAGPVERQG